MSAKVIDLGANRKRILCNFLLVIHINFGVGQSRAEFATGIITHKDRK